MRTSIVMMAVLLASAAVAGEREDELLKAVRKGDAAAVKALLDAGVTANAKFRYDRSVLSFAADRGNREIVELLLAKGADVNAKDTYYGMTPLAAAVYAGHADVVRVMLAKGAEPASSVVQVALEKDSPELLKAAVDGGKASPEHLSAAAVVTAREGRKQVAAALAGLGVKPLEPLAYKADPAALARYAGAYAMESGPRIQLVVENGALLMPRRGEVPPLPFEPMDASTFRLVDSDGVSTVHAELEGDSVKALVIKHAGDPDQRFVRVVEEKK